MRIQLTEEQKKYYVENNQDIEDYLISEGVVTRDAEGNLTPIAKDFGQDHFNDFGAKEIGLGNPNRAGIHKFHAPQIKNGRIATPSKKSRSTSPLLKPHIYAGSSFGSGSFLKGDMLYITFFFVSSSLCPPVVLTIVLVVFSLLFVSRSSLCLCNYHNKNQRCLLV